MYMVCDITDPEIQRILRNQNNWSNVYDEKHGWFHSEVLEICRKIMRLKMQRRKEKEQDSQDEQDVLDDEEQLVIDSMNDSQIERKEKRPPPSTDRVKRIDSYANILRIDTEENKKSQVHDRVDELMRNLRDTYKKSDEQDDDDSQEEQGMDDFDSYFNVYESGDE